MNEDTGLLTHYVLKATSVTQMMKAADVSQCVDVKFAPDGTELPTTTVISKYIYVGCIYNSTDTKWDVVAVANEA